MSTKKQQTPPKQETGLDLVRLICRTLADKKGDAVAALDVRGHSTLTDFIVLASGSSAPHLKAMRNDTLRALKTRGIACFRKAGDPESGWVILDYSDVVLHLFLPQIRAYYALENLWPSTQIDPESLESSLGQKE